MIELVQADPKLLQLSYTLPFNRNDISSKIIEFVVQDLKQKIENRNIKDCFTAKTSFYKIENHKSVRKIINEICEKLIPNSGSSSHKTDQNTQSLNHTSQYKRKVINTIDLNCHKTDQNTQSSNNTSNERNIDNNDYDNDYSCSSNSDNHDNDNEYSCPNNDNQRYNSNSASKKVKNDENGNETLFQKYGGTASVDNIPYKDQVKNIILLMIGKEILIISMGLVVINQQLERNLITDSNTPHEGK